MGRGCTAMPLTPYQEEIARLLSAHRTFDNYLAGGAAIHLEPRSTRYSNDLDYFHDSVERVATAFADDSRQLAQTGHEVAIEMQLPGYIRATVSRDGASTKVEWAHDSAWRFLPTVRHEVVGFVVTLSIWPSTSCWPWRDATRRGTSSTSWTLIAAPCPWARCVGRRQAKTPGSRRWHCSRFFAGAGKDHHEDFARLNLTAPVDLPTLKALWLAALAEADAFVHGGRHPRPVACTTRRARPDSWLQPTIWATPSRTSAARAVSCPASSRTRAPDGR